MGTAADEEFFASFLPEVRGHIYDEFTIGQRFDHPFRRTISRDEATFFSTSMLYWSRLYHDEEHARDLGHETVPVNPYLLLSLAIGISVEDLSEAAGPFLGVFDCEFHRDVYPGETLSGYSEVVDKRLSSSRPEWGIVTWHTTLTNAATGRPALSYRRSNLCALAR